MGHSTGCLTVAAVAIQIDKQLFSEIELYRGLTQIDEDIRYLDIYGKPVIDLNKIYLDAQNIGAKFKNS